MKINEKNLCMFATSPPVDLDGYLQKRGEVNRSWQQRYFVLKGNLLFYFERRGDREPLGLIVIEGCTIELSEDGAPYCFQIVFHGINNRTYFLSAESQTQMEQWMKALTCAGYEYMKLMVSELQRQLDELEGGGVAAGGVGAGAGGQGGGVGAGGASGAAAAAMAAAMMMAEDANAPRPPPRRQNPFNRSAPPPPSAIAAGQQQQQQQRHVNGAMAAAVAGGGGGGGAGRPGGLGGAILPPPRSKVHNNHNHNNSAADHHPHQSSVATSSSGGFTSHLNGGLVLSPSQLLGSNGGPTSGTAAAAANNQPASLGNSHSCNSIAAQQQARITFAAIHEHFGRAVRHDLAGFWERTDPPLIRL